MELIDRLKKEANLKRVAEATGIPYDRMYKWVKGQGNPKAVDTEKLELYYNGNTSNNLDKITLEGSFQLKYLTLLEEIAEERKQKANTIEERLTQIEELLKNKTPSKSKDQEGGNIVEVSGGASSALMDAQLRSIQIALHTMIRAMPLVLARAQGVSELEVVKQLSKIALEVSLEYPDIDTFHGGT